MAVRANTLLVQKKAGSVGTRRPVSLKPATESDERQFEELYEAHFRQVVALCRRFVGSHRDAEALAQDAFLRAWVSFGTFERDRAFWPWLATIARRLCMDEVTGSARRQELLDAASAGLQPVATADEEGVERRVDLHAVRRALWRLPKRHQRLLHLRDVEGWSYKEIARFEGVSVDAVRGTLKRARAAFRHSYDGARAGLLGSFLPGLRRILRAFELGTAGLPRATGLEYATVLAVTALLALGAPSTTSAGTADPVAAPSRPNATAVEATGLDPSPAPRIAGPVRGRSSDAPASPPPPSVSQPGSSEPAPGDLTTLPGSAFAFTASPSYEEDNTVFAYGATPCEMPWTHGCWSLFKSSDGAATWTRLPARELSLAGRVVLPPSYPRDPRIFVAGDRVLSVSEDGGESFRPLIPLAGTVAMSPRFSLGDPRMLIGAAYQQGGPGAEYDVDRNELGLPSFPLPPTASPHSFTFAPTYASDGRVLVSTLDATVDPLRNRYSIAKLYSCTTKLCEPALVAADEVKAPTITTTTSTPDVVFAWSFSRLYRSVDGGRSFEKVPLPGRMHDPAVRWPHQLTAGPNGRVFLTVYEAEAGKPGVRDLYVSEDHVTWEPIARDLDFSSITVLPDGTMLGSRAYAHLAGACSIDGGRSWHPSCTST
ncbi:MAG: RNA polymerase sigma factor [Actinomycetota bacterium]|nr:RNA polymerase sigma factor [Actinomycetota bacterium]